MTDERDLNPKTDLGADDGAPTARAEAEQNTPGAQEAPGAAMPAAGVPTAGPLDHLDPRIRALAAASDEQRIRAILSERLIIYKALQTILNRLHWMVREPRNSRARGEIYMGPPGSGKSSLILLLLKAYPLDARDAQAKRALRVISISASGARTTKTVLNRVLTALGVPTTRRTTGDLEQVVIDTLVRLNVRVLVIDELQDIQHIREAEQGRVLETIKNLMNQARLSVVGFGVPGSENSFNADPHMRARFSNFSLPDWVEGDEFGEFLRVVERYLPLKLRSDLARPEIQKLLLKQCGGSLDQMLRRIKGAAVQAIVDGREQITKDLLEAELPRPPVDVLGNDKP